MNELQDTNLKGFYRDEKMLKLYRSWIIDVNSIISDFWFNFHHLGLQLNGGWIGVDLDGTLAVWNHGSSVNAVGTPIMPMVNRVKKWLSEGKEVRIMTARVSTHGTHGMPNFVENQRRLITDWCIEVFGWALPITCEKDFRMIELWDDRAVRVKTNTGTRCCEE